MIDYDFKLKYPDVESLTKNHVYFPNFPAILLYYTQISDVESLTNNPFYFLPFPAVLLRYFLLDSSLSSLSLTHRLFCKRK